MVNEYKLRCLLAIWRLRHGRNHSRRLVKQRQGSSKRDNLNLKYLVRLRNKPLSTARETLGEENILGPLNETSEENIEKATDHKGPKGSSENVSI